MWLILALLAAAPGAVQPPPTSAGAPAQGDPNPGAPDEGTAAASPAPSVSSAAMGAPLPDPRPPALWPVPVVTPPSAPALPASQPAIPATEPPPRAPLIPFDVHVGGLLQVEYLGIATEGHVLRRLSDMAAPLPPLPPNTPPTPFLDESTALLRRARVSAGGFVATPRLGYFFELEAGEGTVGLLEYRLRIDLGHGLGLNVGQMRVPFSRSWTIREDRLLFPERSVATDQFRYDYDIGVSLDASWLADRLRLVLGGFNGGGRSLARNDNLDPMLVVRIEGQPIGAPQRSPVEGPSEDREPAVVLGAALAADYVPTPPAYGYLSGDPQPPRQLVIDGNADGLPDGITVLEAELDAKVSSRGFAAEVEGYYRHEAWHDIPLLQPAAGTPFVPRTNFAGLFAQLFQSFPEHQLIAGARTSFTALSPLSPGYQRYDQHSCLMASGVTYSCSLPYSDRQLELSAVLAKRLIPRVLQLSGMYSFFLWASSQGAAPTDKHEQRAILLVQLSY